MRKSKILILFTFFIAVSSFFPINVSAQTINLSTEQCGHAIQYGSPIYCTANDSAVEYEFKFFTQDDSISIISSRNYITPDAYGGILQPDFAYRAIVRCRIGENWGHYGDTCITKFVIDWFSETQALYNSNNTSTNRTNCNSIDLVTDYLIPVVFHVVVPPTYEGANIMDYLPPDKINEQLEIINKFFAGGMAERDDTWANAHLQFCFAKKDVNNTSLSVDYNGATFYGITYRSPNEGINVSTDEIAYPTSLTVNENDACSYYTFFPRDKYLNIFVFERMSDPYYYGEAGSMRALGEHVPFSHIRIRRDVVGANREMQSEGKDKGYTAVHELGHFFGLKHTYPDADGIDDLDSQTVPPYNCSETEPNVHNVMNYVNDECRRFFTPGQVCRMRETIFNDSELSNLINSSVAIDCGTTRPNIYSLSIVSPVENILCYSNTRTNTIVIHSDDISMVKQISVNGDLVDLNDNDVIVDVNAGTIEFQYLFNIEGYYDIAVSSGYDDNNANWYTVHKIIETVECEIPTTNLEQAQWYYDSYASLDFREGLARFNDASHMDAVGSEASVCSSNGTLLFYTDGKRIWNSQHELLVNSILDYPVKERSTIILKFSETKYAIVSICENNNSILYNCMVDVNAISNPNVILNWSPLLLGNDWTDLSALSAVPARVPHEYWLFTTKKINGSYYKCSAKLAYNSSNNEIIVSNEYIYPAILSNSPVFSIKVSPDAQYVVYSTESNIIFHRFYVSSGQMEDLGCSPASGIKGSAIEFSQSGNFLYATNITGENSIYITQYDMGQLQCGCNIQQTVICNWEDQYNGNFQAGLNLQRAADGRIYIGRYSSIYPNSRMIGVILNPEVRDDTEGRDNLCGVRMHAIDYNDTQFVNHVNFPNLIDVEEVDSCKVDFFVCADWCPGNVNREINNIINLSNTLQNTWRFYDENNVLIATSTSNCQTDNGRPDSEDYSNIYSHEFVTIELTSSECPSVVRTRTIGHRSNVYPQIVGLDSICKDRHPHSYHIEIPELEPPINVNWTSPYYSNDYDLHLTYNQSYDVNNHILLSAEISDNSTSNCPYLVSKLVGVTQIEYISESIPYCNDDNSGSVMLTINPYPGSNTLPPYVFSDNYENVHFNESSFTIEGLPIGEYHYIITNDYCHYENTDVVESVLSDINISIVHNCEVDTIKLWNDDNTSLSGYSFTLYDIYGHSYEKSTEESMLTLVVSQYPEYSPLVINNICNIDIIGPQPDLCTLTLDVYLPQLPEVNIISYCNDEHDAYVTIILHNVSDRNLLLFDLDFENNSYAVIEFDHADVEGDLYYRIINLSCQDLASNNSLYIEYDGCVIFKGPVAGCAIKTLWNYKPICEAGGLTDIALSIIYPIGNNNIGFVDWTWNNGDESGFSIIEPISDSLGIAYLSDVPAGTYHYTAHIDNCTQEGDIEILETGVPIFTAYTEDDGNIATTEITVESTALGQNTFLVIDSSGSIIMPETIILPGHQYNFEYGSDYIAEIRTDCDTFRLLRAYDITIDLEYEFCYKSEATISFEISGGTAPYTATFTSGNLTTTQTFSNSGQNVMYAEIMQGAANSLVVVSADGHTYNITLNPINYISGFDMLQVPIQDSYIGETLIVPSFQPLSINHNVTFTNCTIYCAYNGYNTIDQTQWIIQPGKTVTFENCTIKSGCPDKMWQGIKIDGDANSAHSSANLHGKVLCQNNTTIEDAIKALESENGGIIMVNNSHFNNNKYDIYYNDYSYSHSIGSWFLIIPNIYNCTFSTTRLLNDNSIYPNAHICLNNVKGIHIRGCTFENTVSYSANLFRDSQRGIGIRSTMSHFHTYSTSIFDKLYYGVYASGFKSNAIDVSNSVFTDNFRGIYVNANPGCTIKNNNITSHFDPAIVTGETREIDFNVYIGSCSTFVFEGNTVSDATTGLYVYNSGTAGNKIQYNTFSNQTNPIVPYNAIIVTGVNSNYVAGNSSTGDVGLEVLCNTFEGNTNDIGIRDGYMRQQQGSSTAPTGNSFRSADLNGGHMQFRTQFSPNNTSYDAYTYDYYQHHENGTPQITHQLKYGYYSNRVNPRNTSIIYINSYCQCSDGGTTLEPYPFNPIPFPGVDRTKSHIQQLGNTLDSAVNEYETKLDGGNTANVLMKVSAITQTTAPSINDLPKDGYLSDTVCNALVAKVEENPVYVTSVFIENSPLPTTTYEDVQDAEISQILKTVLSYYQSGENKRVTDEKAIGDIKQEISLNENLLYDKALNDSLSDTDYAIILDYFNTKTDIDSKIMACNILTSSENYDEARQKVSDIRSLETTEAINCADVMEMYINTMDTDTIMTKEMLKQKRSQLENFMADNNYLYSGLAITLYEYAFDTLIPEYTPLFEDEITQKSSKTEATAEIYPYAIYPNPTSDFINIELAGNVLDDDIIEFLKRYGMEKIEDCENIEINIFDVNSRLVSTGKYKYDTLISIDVSEYTSGTYMVEIRSCWNRVIQTKVVKI
ncbi:MAG: hypothetical protein IKJ56_06410 [Bacteroidales bacterium]|nr:hypothetical protein [Bacteroidales bacterium]